MVVDTQISVVVVNFNSGGYLRRCIESLLDSDASLDIIVVDNASGDRSLQFLENCVPGDHQLRIIRNDENLGFSAAVNIGAKSAGGGYMLVLNPDCQVHRHTVSRLAGVLDEFKNAGLVGALVFNEDGTEQRGCRRNDPTIVRSVITTLGLGRWIESVDMTGQPLPAQPVEVDAVSGSAMMFRMSCFNEIGGMDERYFLHCEDLDVCRRIRNAGYPVLFAPGVSLYHRQGSSAGIDNARIEKLKHQGMMRYYVEHIGADSVTGRFVARGLVSGHYALTMLKLRWRSASAKNSLDDNNHLPANMPVVNQRDTEARVLVTGANSDVGDFLLTRLKENGQEVVALFRDHPGEVVAGNIHWMSLSYFSNSPVDDRPDFNTWIHLAPIWTVGLFRTVFTRSFPVQVVALSSTSVTAKKTSSNSGDQKIVGLLEEGERALADICQAHQSTFVVLRPTLIYGGPRNRNINLVKTLIRWFRFFPLAGKGEGLRQPVHARDVANACLQAIGRQLPKRLYSIGGAEVLNYREMIEKIFESAGQRPRLVKMPAPLLRALTVVVGGLPGLGAFSPDLLSRMERDQVFPNDEANRDFGYDPQGFEP